MFLKEFKMANSLIHSYLNESNKLDGSNYVNCKFKMQTVLEASGVWAIVSGDEAKPATPAQDWEKRENKAKVFLRMFVKDNIIPHIRDCKTSKEMWDILKGLYQTANTN